MPTPFICKADQLPKLNPESCTILDVRTAMEHAEKRLQTKHDLVPLDELNPTHYMQQRGLDKKSAVYILCRSGKRAAQAAEKFNAEGFGNVYVIEGGILACESYGQRLDGHGVASSAAHNNMANKPLSLERQVRIAAGAMVAVGAFLALTLNIWFGLLPFFVGCGLVYAGITDRCGMALLLTKAPWNKMPACTSCTAASTK